MDSKCFDDFLWDTKGVMLDSCCATCKIPLPPHTINVSMVSLIFVTIWRNLVGIGIKLYPNAIHFHTYSIYIGVFIYFPISFDKSRSL